MDYNRERIRNFCIIAHIDHGKSTLADRLLEATGVVGGRVASEQVLDQMELERERGITIKAKAIRLDYKHDDGSSYVLNLIDTPGHVDFSYEVSRSLAACEGALLVVDATQGIQAQTLANFHLALDHGLALIPVLNKIDLASAEPERVITELEGLGFDRSDIVLSSAKTGEGVEDVLRAIIERIPRPAGDPEKPVRALIFDSHYDSYKGVIAYVRVIDGRITQRMPLLIMAAGRDCAADELGVFVPTLLRRDSLSAGEVGFIAAGIKNVKECRVGDTITGQKTPADAALPGYRPATSMVFSGMYPVDHNQYGQLREALEKLQLNDAALMFEPETSVALGFGFRCGFLGLLHLDIVRERLEREYGLELVTTAPNVRYVAVMNDGTELAIENPAHFPNPGSFTEVREPFVAATIIAPSDYVGPVMELCQDRRGTFSGMEYLQHGDSHGRVLLRYELPLGEIMYDFFDMLKSRTRGYASLDYQPSDYRASALVKLEILVAEEPVDALSAIVHRDRAAEKGKKLAERLGQLIPRQLFEVPVQAAIGSRVVARQTIRPLRKDVLAKCYGGDVTRKRKLLERQREGKRRMKLVGSVEIPQEAFLAVLKSND